MSRVNLLVCVRIHYPSFVLASFFQVVRIHISKKFYDFKNDADMIFYLARYNINICKAAKCHLFRMMTNCRHGFAQYGYVFYIHKLNTKQTSNLHFKFRETWTMSMKKLVLRHLKLLNPIHKRCNVRKYKLVP